MTLSIMTLSIMTLSITTRGMVGLYATLSINGTQHDNIEWHCAECRYADFRNLLLLYWVLLCWMSLCRMS